MLGGGGGEAVFVFQLLIIWASPDQKLEEGGRASVKGGAVPFNFTDQTGRLCLSCARLSHGLHVYSPYMGTDRWTDSHGSDNSTFTISIWNALKKKPLPNTPKPRKCEPQKQKDTSTWGLLFWIKARRIWKEEKIYPSVWEVCTKYIPSVQSQQLLWRRGSGGVDILDPKMVLKTITTDVHWQGRHSPAQ